MAKADEETAAWHKILNAKERRRFEWEVGAMRKSDTEAMALRLWHRRAHIRHREEQAWHHRVESGAVWWRQLAESIEKECMRKAEKESIKVEEEHAKIESRQRRKEKDERRRMEKEEEYIRKLLDQ